MSWVFINKVYHHATNMSDCLEVLELGLSQPKRSAHCYSLNTAFVLIDGIKYNTLMVRGKNWLSCDLYLFERKYFRVFCSSAFIQRQLYGGAWQSKGSVT
jgi:hypothetical protein